MVTEKQTWELSAQAEGAGSVLSRHQVRHKALALSMLSVLDNIVGQLFAYYLYSILYYVNWGGHTQGASNAPLYRGTRVEGDGGRNTQ